MLNYIWDLTSAYRALRAWWFVGVAEKSCFARKLFIQSRCQCACRADLSDLDGLSDTNTSGYLIPGVPGEPVRVRSTQPRANLQGDSCNSFCQFTETRELPNHLSRFWGFPEHRRSTGALCDWRRARVLWSRVFQDQSPPQNKEMFEALEDGPKEEEGGGQGTLSWMVCSCDDLKITGKEMLYTMTIIKKTVVLWLRVDLTEWERLHSCMMLYSQRISR